jgi:hypothetical protein
VPDAIHGTNVLQRMSLGSVSWLTASLRALAALNFLDSTASSLEMIAGLRDHRPREGVHQQKMSSIATQDGKQATQVLGFMLRIDLPFLLMNFRKL